MVKRLCLLMTCLLMAACVGNRAGGRPEPAASSDAIQVTIDFNCERGAAIVTLTNQLNSMAGYYGGEVSIRFRDGGGQMLSRTELDKEGFVSSVYLSSLLIVPPVPLVRLNPRASVKREFLLDTVLMGMGRHSGLADLDANTLVQAQFRYWICFDRMLDDCRTIDSSWFDLGRSGDAPWSGDRQSTGTTFPPLP